MKQAQLAPLMGGLFFLCAVGSLLLPTLSGGVALIAPLSLFLAAALSALVIYDIRERRLPNMITFPLLIIGLVQAVIATATIPFDALIGAILGYSFIALLRKYYLWRRGIEAIGLGDAKLMAAFGAWFGWAALPLALAISAISALTVTIALSLAQQKPLDSSQKIPFGPYICFSFWLFWWLKVNNIVTYPQLFSVYF